KASTVRDIDAAFVSLAEMRADALLVATNPFFFIRAAQLVVLAVRYAIPTLYFRREFVVKADLVIAVEGDRRLFNQYGVILVNPAKHPHVKKELGQQFIDWLISDEGQKAIADYKVNGEQLFWPQRE